MPTRTPVPQSTVARSTPAPSSSVRRTAKAQRPRATLPAQMPAQVPAHLSSQSHEWPTPADFFSALDGEFGFVLDVCATTTNRKAGAYYALDHHDPARRDGLAGDWSAEAAELSGAVWMNPPYGRPIGAWMGKAFTAARAGAVVVTLVPVRADTAWWHEHVLATGAEVRYVRGRLTFGDAVNTAAFASAVVIYRPTDVVGAPGPVTTMPAHPTSPTELEHAHTRSAGQVHPAPRTASRSTRSTQTPRASRPTQRTGSPASAQPHSRHTHQPNPTEPLDCRKCQRQTVPAFEHVFEHRVWVETADTARAGAHHA